MILLAVFGTEASIFSILVPVNPRKSQKSLKNLSVPLFLSSYPDKSCFFMYANL